MFHLLDLDGHSGLFKPLFVVIDWQLENYD